MAQSKPDAMGSEQTERALEAQLGSIIEPIARLAQARGGLIRSCRPGGEAPTVLGAFGAARSALDEGASPPECAFCGLTHVGNDALAEARPQACPPLSRWLGKDQEALRAYPFALDFDGQMQATCCLFMEPGKQPDENVQALLRSMGHWLGVTRESALRDRRLLAEMIASERRMIAGELHDSVLQILSFMRMRFPLLKDALVQGHPGAAERLFGDLSESTDAVYIALRELLSDFRAKMSHQSLVPALREAANDLFGTTGVELTLDEGLEQVSLDAEQEIQVLLIVQESLSNIARHAQARHANLSVQVSGEAYELVLEDDGIGMERATRARHDPRAGLQHFGLQIMKERAITLGGWLEMEAREPNGTRLRLHFPKRISASVVTP